MHSTIWETVVHRDKKGNATDRLEVPNGWIYRDTKVSNEGDLHVTTVFVPADGNTFFVDREQTNTSAIIEDVIMDFAARHQQPESPPSQPTYEVWFAPTLLGQQSFKWVHKLVYVTGDLETAREVAYFRDIDEPSPDKHDYLRYVVIEVP